ncbi:unnamed protein product, partial [marine sediment metagenome]
MIDISLREINCSRIKNALEIGAGSAHALILLRDKCDNPSINFYVCELGKQWEEYYKIQRIQKIADFFPFKSDKTFDYIHLSHWLDHVISLNETISELNKIMNPNGYVFVEVHNTEHAYWSLPLNDTPHIHFFTQKSLVEAFVQKGGNRG